MSNLDQDVDLSDRLTVLLDKIQRQQELQQQNHAQLDDVIQRLECIQDSLDKQNQNQKRVEERLSDVTRRLSRERCVEHEDVREKQKTSNGLPQLTHSQDEDGFKKAEDFGNEKVLNSIEEGQVAVNISTCHDVRVDREMEESSTSSHRKQQADEKNKDGKDDRMKELNVGFDTMTRNLKELTRSEFDQMRTEIIQLVADVLNQTRDKLEDVSSDLDGIDRQKDKDREEDKMMPDKMNRGKETDMERKSNNDMCFESKACLDGLKTGLQEMAEELAKNLQSSTEIITREISMYRHEVKEICDTMVSSTHASVTSLQDILTTTQAGKVSDLEDMKNEISKIFQPWCEAICQEMKNSTETVRANKSMGEVVGNEIDEMSDVSLTSTDSLTSRDSSATETVKKIRQSLQSKSMKEDLRQSFSEMLLNCQTCMEGQMQECVTQLKQMNKALTEGRYLWTTRQGEVPNSLTATSDNSQKLVMEKSATNQSEDVDEVKEDIGNVAGHEPESVKNELDANVTSTTATNGQGQSTDSGQAQKFLSNADHYGQDVIDALKQFVEETGNKIVATFTRNNDVVTASLKNLRSEHIEAKDGMLTALISQTEDIQNLLESKMQGHISPLNHQIDECERKIALGNKTCMEEVLEVWNKQREFDEKHNDEKSEEIIVTLKHLIKEEGEKVLEMTRKECATLMTSLRQVIGTLQDHFHENEKNMAFLVTQESGSLRTSLGILEDKHLKVKDEILTQMNQQSETTGRHLDTKTQEVLDVLAEHICHSEKKIIAQSSAVTNVVKEAMSNLTKAQYAAMNDILTISKETAENSEKHLEAKTDSVTTKLQRRIDQAENKLEVVSTRECALIKGSIDTLHAACLKMSESALNIRRELADDTRKHLDSKLQEINEDVKKHVDKSKTDLVSVTEKEGKEIRDEFKDLIAQNKTETLEVYEENTEDIKSNMDSKIQACIDELKQHTDHAKDELVSATETECRLLTCLLTDLTTQTETSKCEIVRVYLDETRDLKEHVTCALHRSTEQLKQHTDKLTNETVAVMKRENSLCTDKLTELTQGLRVHQDENMKELVNHIYNVRRESKLILSQVTDYNKTTLALRESVLLAFTEQTQDTQTRVITTLKDSVEKLMDNMYKMKREIFAMTEKETQHVLDSITRAVHPDKIYTCHFYVDNFKSLIGTDKAKHSLPWRIHQYQSSVSGFVHFQADGKMSVWLVYGRHPLEVGLLPRSKVMLRVKATITDTSGKLPEVLIGEKISSWDENLMQRNEDCGFVLGNVACDGLVQEGYADIYSYGAILVRYEIELL